MRWFRKPLGLSSLAAGCLLIGAGLRAGALEEWLQHAVAGSPVEAALYRVMALPGVEVLFPRPPRESAGELSKLIANGAPEAGLYRLRALEEERALDFSAAEADWKTFAARGPDRSAGMLALADFYHRRLDVQPEYETLLAIAAAPDDAYIQITAQASWQALERALSLAGDQTLNDNTVSELWQRWIARYPGQPSVYGRAFTWQLDHGYPANAQKVVAQYRAAFPHDDVFPIKAAALLALHGGGPDSPDAQQRALAVYDAAFQPLWPADLVQSYFDLLDATHQARRFLSAATERLARDPDDLNASARLFFYHRQHGQAEAALAALDAYRQSKEQRKAAWTAEELYTQAQLTASAQAYTDTARYDFALAHAGGTLPGGRSAAEAGLSGMVDVLLTAPDQPISLGAGNLSMYRDIGTLDQGPGYWNGILSLWFNGQSPTNEFAQEEQKAQPYFHRAKARELLALLDHEDPGAPMRDSLHAKLLEAYADYGDNAAVVHEGTAFLADFPKSGLRVSVALSLADAYARQNDASSEFALYDRLLVELGQEAQKMPLTAAAASGMTAGTAGPPTGNLPADETNRPDIETIPQGTKAAFLLETSPPRLAPNPSAAAYAQVLDRYLGRLTAMHQLPQALAVLRKELDRNPDDPVLYEKLAGFLEQNNLAAQQEEVYRRAIAKFPSGDWYDKLARFYLREQRLRDFAQLSRQVTDIFSGTELDAYFGLMHSSGSELFLEINLYAHKRFPHDLVFTQNLLEAYSGGSTKDYAKGTALLRQTWWQSPELTQRFFEFLSYSGKLDAELAQLGPKPANPAALEELGEAELWRSHFERAAPKFTALAASYPADQRLGRTAADLERSLAWLDPSGPQQDIAAAVEIEKRLLSTNSGDLDRLARIGDILADHADASSASLAPAAVFWRRMPEVAPGRQDNYLQAATVFWDYFQFDDALREIDQARTRFHQPALFGYEAGAIAEGKRDEALAVREYVGAALVKEGDASTTRLLQLAKRPGTAALVDAATALGPDPGLAAVRLRVAVLAAQRRSGESAPLLLAAVKRATMADQADELAAYAQTLGLTLVRESALAREAELTQDPVQRLELRYELARSYENRGDMPEAARLIDATYKENPRLLGVVRATVDFDWRSKRQPQAIAVLLEAAHAAQPELSRQLTAEAAAKANESGDRQQARQLAESLLAKDPYNPQYIALVADSYSGDDAGLARFYNDRLQAVRAATMAEHDRNARTALLRKGLIPALTRGANYQGAVDQYIALISAYPEDSSLVDEGALYALRYERQKQLLDFLSATNQASPRDSRFFIDLAQAQTVFGDPGAAIDAYARAIAIRKDRSDLYTAKATLEETLGRFDDAAADYSRLYQLSYKDPQWMVATARVRARQGRAAEAVTALEAAYLRGTQSLPRDYFRVASQLEEWNLLEEARRYAEQGAKAAGDDFLAGDSQGSRSDDPATYARILTRLRQTSDALTTLRAGLAAASAGVVVDVVEQVRSHGVASVSDAEWRKQRIAQRRQQATVRYNAALEAMSTAVDLYYTPEEKAGYASTLTQQRQGASLQDLAERWIPAAHTAGLAGLEAGWRKELLLQASAGTDPQAQPYAALERARMLFTELGQTLETLLRRMPLSSPGRPEAVQQAADAYRASGDFRAEIRVLRLENVRDGGILRERYLDLLFHHDPAALVASAGAANESLADQAANFALAGASPATALAAVKARGQALSAVWSSSYTALAGLYLRDTGAGTGAAFEQALRLEATIGDRVGSQPDLNSQLTGATWFYDAARYGQWRTLTPSADAEEVLAADLESSVVASNYMALANTYAEAGNAVAALVELDHALELDPGSAEIYDAKAVLLWRAGRKQEAVAAWQAALNALREQEDRGHPDEGFWTTFRRIARRVKNRGLFGQLKPQLDTVLRVYMRRNGAYRSNELLQAAYESAPDPAGGVDWLLSLAMAASDPLYVLQDLDDGGRWLPPAAREAVLLEEVRLLRNRPSGGENAPGEDYRLQAAESRLLNLYLKQEQNVQAQALLESLTPAQRELPDFAAAAILIAGRIGSIEALLASYRSRSEEGPEAKTLESTAARLQSEKRLKPARALLEFAFSRGQATHSLQATEYLALAEIRLQTGDTAGAVGVLEALSRSEGDTYANLDSAATLLEKNAQPVDAIPFLTTLTHSVPWELSYAVRLAEAQQHAHTPGAAALVSVARNPLAPYALRARAALDLAREGGSAAALGSGELALLASAKVPAGASRQPYFVTARAVAAVQVEDAHLRAQLLGEALAIAPAGIDAPSQRLALFRAQFTAGDMIAARASLDVMQETGAAGVLNDADASAHQQAVLDGEVAAVYLATGGRDIALGWLRDQVKALPPGAEASAVERRIAALEAAARIEAANAGRRPLVRKALDQPGIVRSQLGSIASAAAADADAVAPAAGEGP